MDTRLVGAAAAQLGAGRERKGDAVDYGAGIELHKKPGDFVRKGDSIATVSYTHLCCEEARKRLQ